MDTIPAGRLPRGSWRRSGRSPLAGDVVPGLPRRGLLPDRAATAGEVRPWSARPPQMTAATD